MSLKYEPSSEPGILRAGHRTAGIAKIAASVRGAGAVHASRNRNRPRQPRGALTHKANTTHIRQSRPDSGHGFQVKVVETF